MRLFAAWGFAILATACALALGACMGGDDDDDDDSGSDDDSDWRELICEKVSECDLDGDLGIATQEECLDFVNALDADAFDCSVTANNCSAFSECFADDNDDDDDGVVSGDTWLDEATGLTWEVKPYSLYVTWEFATTRCEELDLDGGGWRLPTISELRTLIRGCGATMPGGECPASDECTTYDECWDLETCNCDGVQGPNNGCFGPSELPFECDGFWSSTTSETDPNFAWYAFFGSGGVYGNTIDAHSIARCVRE